MSLIGFLQNVQMGSAAKRNVGTGAGQIPDMSAWQFGGDTNSGWQRLPDGTIEQWGVGMPDALGLFTINYHIAFSTRPVRIGFSYRQSNTPTSMQSIVINDQINNNLNVQVKCLQFDGAALKVGQSSFFWNARSK
ncbi:MAG: gp53-like domain-containing protein [Plesiomonas shigelloides]